MIDIERLHASIQGKGSGRATGFTFANAVLTLQSIVDGYDGKSSRYLVIMDRKENISEFWDCLLEVAHILFCDDESLYMDNHDRRGIWLSREGGNVLGEIHVISKHSIDTRIFGNRYDGILIDNGTKLTEHSMKLLLENQ